MSQNPDRCLKCDAEMEQGFIMDVAHGARLVSSWAAGPPVKSFWLGTKMPEEQLIPVGVFRCVSCGFLEAYARPEFKAE